MTYTIELKARLIRIVGTGVLSDDDMVRCISALRADPPLEPDMNALSDMREIEVGFTARGVSRMVDVMKRTADKRHAAKAAIVVGSDVSFGMGRMVELWSDERVDPSFRIFRDMDSAREWLGIG